MAGARSKLFAIRAIKAYTELNKRHFDDVGKVLAKQFLRASTSIGANCPKGYRFAYAEAEFAQSKADLYQSIL
jgi:four helix bundle protein